MGERYIVIKPVCLCVSVCVATLPLMNQMVNFEGGEEGKGNHFHYH